MNLESSRADPAGRLESPAAPRVSIITATYNRSNVLRIVIETVRRQTVTDWEWIIIGDACTDDTADVVASFGDPRIRFENLQRGYGEQSGPHNEALSLTRARHLAYLNHDDLWLPDHLQVTLAALRVTQADLVFPLVETILPDVPPKLLGASPSGRYVPYVYVPPSAWVLRRELIEEFGPWRSARDCYENPSEDLLFRAWQAGKDMRLVPRLTLLTIPSGWRNGSYARREVEEHEAYAERIREEPDFRERELSALALRHASDQFALGPTLALTARNTIRQGLVALGLRPMAVRRFLQYGRKGAMLNAIRRRRGLPPIDWTDRPS
ncbi:MAG TPA: glycosyltransferase [Methylomirabilota bacterium]|jgi:glycosyltransferase involved in cell wall biosynthesis|nr:glycosyltransferase [Methylomirabilota bacterium]